MWGFSLVNARRSTGCMSGCAYIHIGRKGVLYKKMMSMSMMLRVREMEMITNRYIDSPRKHQNENRAATTD